jgi:hypothetical protein
MTEAKKWMVYALADPEDRGVRYVGYTFGTTRDRLRRHVNDSQRKHSAQSRNAKAAWIRGLVRRDKRPVVVVLQEGDGDAYCRWEKFWMGLFLASGARLLNSATGPLPKKDVAT